MKVALFMMLAVILLLPVASHAELLSTGTYTVVEMGFGRFRATDEKGNTVLLHLSRGVSRFEPDDWIMHEGDKVYVEYMPTFRNRPTPTCVLVRLVERGPASSALVSPLEGLVEEMGRANIRVRVATDEGDILSFQFALGRRDTRYEPSGWAPQAGDRVRVQFSTRASLLPWQKTLVANLIQRLEKTDEAAAEPARRR